jgi:hypothetical protein
LENKKKRCIAMDSSISTKQEKALRCDGFFYLDNVDQPERKPTRPTKATTALAEDQLTRAGILESYNSKTTNNKKELESTRQYQRFREKSQQQQSTNPATLQSFNNIC